jgi:ectoine hydroxylase-related dioxygenase (phytanoyl-CoA dioxygenase family)
MTTDEILARPAKILSEQQRRDYFDKGYVMAASIIPKEWIERLLAVTNSFVEKSRFVTKSNKVFDVDTGHSADSPKLRRLSSPVDQDSTYWEFASSALMADIAEDLLGPNVKFHHSKLNFKWAEAGQEVKWHQDIQAWPHTDYSPLTMGIYLQDTTKEMGPLLCVPGSHEGELFDHFDEGGKWIGHIRDEDLPRVDIKSAEMLSGPAGSITIHNCRTVHASEPNLSPRGRPLLLHTYSAGESFPYTPNPIPSPHSGEIIRGKRPKWANHDPRPCMVPPDWSGGYGSIFQAQQGQAGM